MLVLCSVAQLMVPGSDVSLLLGGALQTLLLVGTASLALAFGAALLAVHVLDATWEREWAEEIHSSLPTARPGRAVPSVLGALATVVVVSPALPLTVWTLLEQTPVRYTLETVAADLPHNRDSSSHSVDRRIDLRAVEDGTPPGFRTWLCPTAPPGHRPCRPVPTVAVRNERRPPCTRYPGCGAT